MPNICRNIEFFAEFWLEFCLDIQEKAYQSNGYSYSIGDLADIFNWEKPTSSFDGQCSDDTFTADIVHFISVEEKCPKM